MNPLSAAGSLPMGERNSLDVARDSFALLVTGPRPLSLDGRRFSGLPQRRLALDEVRDLLLARRCPQSTSDEVWAALVRRSRSSGPAWVVGATGVALPALISVAAMLARRCPGDPSEVHAEVLRGFLEALRTVDVDRPWVVLRLRWAAFRAGHAALGRVFANEKRHVVRASEHSVGGHPDLVLARAVADGVLTATTADLIGTTRLESVSITEWAARRGVTEWAAYKARRRAELRLATYLREQLMDADDDITERVAAAMALTKKPCRMSKADAIASLQGQIESSAASSEVRPCA